MIELDTDDLVYFKKEHVVSVAAEWAENFKSSSTEYRHITVVVGPQTDNAWSIQDFRRYLVFEESKSERLKSAWGGGQINSSPTFNLATSQQEFIDLCTTMQHKMVALQLTHGVEEYCFMREFKDWCLWKGYAWPIPEHDFVALLLS